MNDIFIEPRRPKGRSRPPGGWVDYTYDTEEALADRLERLDRIGRRCGYAANCVEKALVEFTLLGEDDTPEQRRRVKCCGTHIRDLAEAHTVLCERSLVQRPRAGFRFLHSRRIDSNGQPAEMKVIRVDRESVYYVPVDKRDREAMVIDAWSTPRGIFQGQVLEALSF